MISKYDLKTFKIFKVKPTHRIELHVAKQSSFGERKDARLHSRV